MGTTYPCGARQGRQAVQRVEHLCWGTFEKAATATRKQGVATKKQGVLSSRLGPEGDMPQGMSGYIQHIKIQAMPFESVALLDGVHLHRHCFKGRAEALRTRACHEFSQTACVVCMVVRD